MLNIPETVKALFKLDACRKNFRVHFPNGEMDDLTNSDVVEESVEFSESICSQSTFRFGLSESSTIEFETVGVSNMLGMTIDCGIEIDLSSLTVAQLAEIASGSWDGEYVALADSDIGYAFFHVPYGRFIVRQCPRDHQAMTHRRVVAYTDTKSLVTPFQTKLLAAKSIESKYTPSFTNMMFAVFAQNKEQALIDAGFTKTVINSFNNGTANVYQHWTSAFDAPAGATKPYIFLLLNERSLSFEIGSGANDASKLYGVSGIEGITSQDVFAAVASKLASDYGVAESQAKDMARYYQFYTDTRVNTTYARMEKPKVVSFSTVNHGQYFVNPFVDLTEYNGFFCLNADREGVNTIVSVLDKVTVDLYYSDSSTTHPSASATHETFVISADGLSAASFNKYAMPSSLSNSDFELQLTPTATFKQTEYGSTTKYTVNTFENALDISKTMSDYLEVNALFASPNRAGSYRSFSLSDTAVESLDAGEYSEFWWDEYDVEPIGKVKYLLGDDGQDNTVTYDFSESRSTYDMSENEILKQGNKTQDQVEAFLDSSFIPKLDVVRFTPIEITIGNGLPYLEAGDCIEAVSEDEITAKSFILEQRISGIQHLVQEAESSGGKLIDGTEEEY